MKSIGFLLLVTWQLLCALLTSYMDLGMPVLVLIAVLFRVYSIVQLILIKSSAVTFIKSV